MSVDELRAVYDTQLRGRDPKYTAIGAMVERDGPVVRTHYGTHGTVDHRDLLDVDLREVVERQKEVFSARYEPVEWKVYSHDSTTSLADVLLAAGFVPGWERSVLVGGFNDIKAVGLPPRQRICGLARRTLLAEEVRALVAQTGPHRRPLHEVEADGYTHDLSILALQSEARLLGAAWAVKVPDTQFTVIEGMTGTHPEFAYALVERTRNRTWGFDRTGRNYPYYAAEADGDLRKALIGVGFQEISTVRSYHWPPLGTPSSTRPVEELLGDPEGDALWTRFIARSDALRESGRTWHLGTVDEKREKELDAVVARGLLSCARPGERLFYLREYTQGYRFDPRRVGGAGQPRWPGWVYPDDWGRNCYLTSDLRMGTVSNYQENSLCVFGADLVAAVADEITALLGLPDVWTSEG